MILKKFFHRWLKIRFLTKSGVCYNSIEELPIWNWFKVFETKELNYLIKNGTVNDEQLSIVWRSLFAEYIDVFGIDESLSNYIKQEKRLVTLELEYAINKKGSDLFKIQIEREKIKEKDAKKVQGDYMKLVTNVESALKREINEKEMSVRKFYTYLKDLKNGN